MSPHHCFSVSPRHQHFSLVLQGRFQVIHSLFSSNQFSFENFTSFKKYFKDIWSTMYIIRYLCSALSLHTFPVVFFSNFPKFSSYKDLKYNVSFSLNLLILFYLDDDHSWLSFPPEYWLLLHENPQQLSEVSHAIVTFFIA